MPRLFFPWVFRVSFLGCLSSLVFLQLALSAAPESYRWGTVAMGGGGFVSGIVASSTEKNLFYARTDVGGAYRWNEANASWIPLTDWVGEDQVGFLGVESIALDPNSPAKVYMLVGINYFNGGKSAILRSNDYGENFTVTEITSQFKAHGNGMGRQTGERLVVDPNDSSVLFCGTRSAGLFKSTNSGSSWIRVTALGVVTTPNENGIDFVVFDKASGSQGKPTPTVYLGISRNDSNLYVSKNGGDTWSLIAGRPTDLMPGRAVLASDGSLVITYGNGAGPSGHWAVPEPMDKGAIWKYAPSKGTWSNITPTGITRAFGGITVDAKDPNRMVATTINTYLEQPWGWGDRIFVSANGGLSWSDLFGDKQISMNTNGIPWIAKHAIHWAGSVTLDPFNSQRVFVTSGNGIFMTQNLDTKPSIWSFAAKGLEETVPLDLISIPGGPLLSVMGDYDGFVHSDIHAYSPTGLFEPQIGTTSGLAYATKKTTFVVRVGGDDKGEKFPIYYSENSGSTWTKFATKPSGGTLYQGKIAVAADGGAVLWCPSGSSTTYRTADKGLNWTTVAGLSFESVPVADAVNPQKFYAYNPNAGSLFSSLNGGLTFTQAATPGSNGSKIIRTVWNREGDIWLARAQGLYHSTNSGISFAAITGVSNCTAIGIGAAAPNQSYPALYLWGKANGGVTGMYRSIDSGQSWERINDAKHQYGGPGNGQFVVGDANLFGQVYMSTAGRGIVYGEPGSLQGIGDGRATRHGGVRRNGVVLGSRGRPASPGLIFRETGGQSLDGNGRVVR
jgi:xyloglucan-specific exo-beta-1,4-glucanase